MFCPLMNVALDFLFEELRSYYDIEFFKKIKKRSTVESPKRFQWTMLELIFSFEYLVSQPKSHNSSPLWYSYLKKWPVTLQDR